MTRPICNTPDCNNLCQNSRSKANPLWRKVCAICHVKKYQAKWSIERIKRTKVRHKKCQLKWKRANPDKVKTAALRAQAKHYVGFESITKMKCKAYFNNDKKQNKWNGYNSVNKMVDDLIDLVHENMKRNNGEVRCEVTNVVLSHELKDIFQISFDRKDNTIGHDRSNIRIVLEPVNTWIKDKFTINDLNRLIDAIIEERVKAA